MIMCEKSIIADTAQIYENLRIINSKVSPYCCIGQDCDLVETTMHTHSELGRRNIIRNSSIGTGSYTGTNTVIKNSVIGKYCSISWNVSIGGGNHDYKRVSMYTDYWYNRTFGIEKPHDNISSTMTHVGNDVWIGAGANIIGGVTIGDGVVIGAGAVVTESVLPYSIVMGVPAKLYKMRFSDEIIELLEKIKWWDWNENQIKKNIMVLQSEPTVEILRKYLKDDDET